MRKFFSLSLILSLGALAYLFWRRARQSVNAPIYDLSTPLPPGNAAALPTAAATAEAARATHAYGAPATGPDPAIAPAPTGSASPATIDEQAADSNTIATLGLADETTVEAPSTVAKQPMSVGPDATIASEPTGPADPDLINEQAADTNTAETIGLQASEAPADEDVAEEEQARQSFAPGVPGSPTDTEPAEEPAESTVSASGSSDALPDLVEEAASDTPHTLVDLNTATEEELVELPGIGTYLASRIIAFREARGPFTSVADLLDISGIGPNNIREFEEFLTVTPPDDHAA